MATEDQKKLYAFSRKLDNEEVIVIVNRSNKPQLFTHEALKNNYFKNVFTHRPVSKRVTVSPMELVVLSNK
jgi:hypothetical protein